MIRPSAAVTALARARTSAAVAIGYPIARPAVSEERILGRWAESLLLAAVLGAALEMLPARP